MAARLAVLIGFIRQMPRGWLHRAQRRQAELIDATGTADTVGPALDRPGPKGSTSAAPVPHWNDRIAAGALGFRAKGALTSYPEESRQGTEASRSDRLRVDRGDPHRTAMTGKALTTRASWRSAGSRRRLEPIDTGFRPTTATRNVPMGQGGSSVTSQKAVLVLVLAGLTGTPFGAIGQTLGEAVFSTGMSGYQKP